MADDPNRTGLRLRTTVAAQPDTSTVRLTIAAPAKPPCQYILSWSEAIHLAARLQRAAEVAMGAE